MKTVLNKIFFMAAAEGWVNKDLPAFIILPPLNEKERTPFTKEEQKMLWTAYENGCLDAAFALIMIHTGMMPGELQQITASMIDFENHIICGAGLKTDIRRETPIVIPDCLVPVLMDVCERIGAKPDEPIIGVKSMRSMTIIITVWKWLEQENLSHTPAGIQWQPLWLLMKTLLLRQS